MSFKIEIIKGDITKCEVAAIVNAANNNFWMGSGVAGAIKKEGGEIIEREAVKKGPVMPGEAVFSTAGSLPYKVIIHAAVMGQDLKTTAPLIRKATVSSLNLSESLSLESLAFPAFGTGVGGFPMKACANLMIAVVAGYQPIANHLKLVQFCLFDEYGFHFFKESLTNSANRGSLS